jgi:polysaccharide export outer membrane protein
MKLLRCGFYLILVLPALAAGLAEQTVGKPVITAAPAATPPPAPAAAPANSGPVSASYVIGADDTLQVTVWGQAQLSATQTVRPDGKISLPLINDTVAAGFTPEQLAAEITSRLTKFVTDPVVGVSVTAVNSKRVFMVGEIGRQGPLSLTPGMTALQAISSAGGLGPYAKDKKIYILRGDPGKQQKIPFDYRKAFKGENQGVALMPGDTIVVP